MYISVPVVSFVQLNNISHFDFLLNYSFKCIMNQFENLAYQSFFHPTFQEVFLQSIKAT